MLFLHVFKSFQKYSVLSNQKPLNPLSICPFVLQSFCPPVRLSFSLFDRQSFCPSVCSFFCPFVCQSFCPSVRWSVSPFVHQYVSPFVRQNHNCSHCGPKGPFCCSQRLQSCQISIWDAIHQARLRREKFFHRANCIKCQILKLSFIIIIILQGIGLHAFEIKFNQVLFYFQGGTHALHWFRYLIVMCGPMFTYKKPWLLAPIFKTCRNFSIKGYKSTIINNSPLCLFCDTISSPPF